MRRGEAGEVLAMLERLYPGRPPLQADTVAVYGDALVGYEPADALAGVRHCAETSKFFPTLAELLEAIDVARGERRAQEAYEARRQARALLAAPAPPEPPTARERLSWREMFAQSLAGSAGGRAVLGSLEWGRRWLVGHAAKERRLP